MNRYYRLVIDLYKEVTHNNNEVNEQSFLSTRAEIASAITAANIAGNDTSELEALLNDIDQLNELT